MPDIQAMAHAIRFLAFDAIRKVGEGHQGVPLGMAEIAATLCANHLIADPDDPLWPDRDRVVLSNGHGSMLLYAMLHLCGHKAVCLDALKTFRKLGSVCAGHPEIDQPAGIEITTGLLGQGIASAVGMAVAEQRLQAEFGADLVGHRTWAFVGDGCLQEGMGQEAISLAGHLQLGNLTVLWDDNQITDDGDTNLSISEDIPVRFRAAHWHVVEVDGHDIAAIDAALSAAKADPRPSLMACRTRIARGIPRLEGQRGGHSAPLTDADGVEMRAALGWDHPAFEVPEDIYRDYAGAMQRGRNAHQDWTVRYAAHPRRADFDRWHKGPVPNPFPQAAQANIATPTIQSSGDICDLLADEMPETLVLCADLEAPTNHKRSRAAFSAINRGGSYVHCGVREHLMGAMACGIAAHGGLRPISVTYLAFSDYQRAAMRMAALMRLPVIFVFSHDSIGVGSNGPTHQPVEILASFRAMPNMQVIRPADAVETGEAWQIALETRDGPTMLALSRQPADKVRSDATRNASQDGAYVLADAAGPRQLTLLATGTEVGLAMAAQARLEAEGIATAIVSMPCWELFAGRSAEDQQDVLGDAPRLGIEAATRFGWSDWLRLGDEFLGLDGFGASATADVLYEHFGLTVDAIIQHGRDLARRS